MNDATDKLPSQPHSSTTNHTEQIRIIATQKLQQLRDEIQHRRRDQEVTTIPSWINQHRVVSTGNQGETTTATATTTTTELAELRSEQCLFFDYAGFIHIPSFVTPDMYQSMKGEIRHIIETQWNPTEDSLEGDTFGTNEQQNISRGDYFLTSSNRVHFFTEPKAMMDVADVATTDENAEIQTNPKQKQKLKLEYRTKETKIYALNKIGHGLHLLPNSSFQQYTMSKNVRHLLHDLGWVDPVVPQSMYIFKQANNIGGVVNSHQDSTFLYTTPYPTCIGLWLAIDDATIENGCLWVRPGSHNSANDTSTTTSSIATTTEKDTIANDEYLKHNVRRQYRRNVLYFGIDAIQERSNIPQMGSTTGTGESTIDQPMFEMDLLFYDDTVPWDGSIPGKGDVCIGGDSSDAVVDDSYYCDYESLLQAGFIPIECKAGDLLAFTGTLDHLSLGNHHHHHDGSNNSTSYDDSRPTVPPSSSVSSSSRHTFQLHIVEGPNQGIEWSPYNWLQYPNHQPFLRLNE